MNGIGPDLGDDDTAAALAICRLVRIDKWPAIADRKAAATVSPAPDTSKTSCAVAGLFHTLPSRPMTVMPFPSGSP